MSIIFFDDAKYLTSFIDRLIDVGMIHFVDKSRHHEEAWVISQLDCGAQFFNIAENNCIRRIESFKDIDYEQGLLCLYSDTPFAYKTFIEALLDPESDLQPFFEKFGFHPIITETMKKMPAPKRSLETVEEEKEKDCYSFETHYDEDADTMYYEVCKPNTDRPFSTLIHPFSEKGHIDLFPSLFVSSAWGVSKDDVPFLEHVWNKLEMPGLCNLEEIVKECVFKCQQGAPEPKLWRISLAQLLEKFKKVCNVKYGE